VPQSDFSRFGEIYFICANIRLLRSTGWRPTYSLSAAVADTVSRLAETRGAA
jgi:nucleoside-diphosphate-sugar epimerase